MSEDEFRTEDDPVVGQVRVPRDALYGPQTQTALENFSISEMGFPREFVEALGEVKRAAADANVALGRLDEERREAIRAAELLDAERGSRSPPSRSRQHATELERRDSDDDPRRRPDGDRDVAGM